MSRQYPYDKNRDSSQLNQKWYEIEKEVGKFFVKSPLGKLVYMYDDFFDALVKAQDCIFFKDVEKNE